jgi:hypothetical protein
MSKHLKSLLYHAARLGQRLAALERNPRSNPLTVLRLKSARQIVVEKTRRAANGLLSGHHHRSIR